MLESTLDFFKVWILPVIQSLLASYLFLTYLFRRLRPQIVIADQIAQVHTDEGTAYRFKIVNTSSYKAFDINIALFEVTILAGGLDIKLKRINLHNNITSIAFLVSKSEGEADLQSSHACLFRTQEDLKRILGDDSAYLLLQITARHETSGLPRVFMKKYHEIKDIKEGNYERGTSTVITK